MLSRFLLQGLDIMDWEGACERNHAILLRIVAQLFVLARIAPGEVPGAGPWERTLPRYVWRAVMLVLAPAEAAMRRLLVIAARGRALKAGALPAAPSGLIAGKGAACRAPLFNMFDPMKSFEDYWKPVLEGAAACPFPAALAEPQRCAPVGAISLWRRLQALHHAASNLPRAARRYLRWQARCQLALNRPALRQRASLLRPGYAPGYPKRRSRHEVQELLVEVHALAMQILSPPRRGPS